MANDNDDAAWMGEQLSLLDLLAELEADDTADDTAD
jgi:hypothetical protein